MYSFLLNKDITEKSVVPCYLLYGEEPFLAQEFVQLLRECLSSSSEEINPVERMDLAELEWIDVMDLARTVPFLFTAWRLIEVKIPKIKAARISKKDEEIIKAYLESPTQRTVVIFVVPEKMKRGFSLMKCMSSFPPSVVCTKEINVLKNKSISIWMDRKFELSGKKATSSAKKRLIELTGFDLALLNSEIEKIITFVDDKNVIEPDDVHQVSGMVKSFFKWELTSSLEKGDHIQSVTVLKTLLTKENVKPQFILGIVVGFFRDILTTKIWLKEGKDKSAIFKGLRPHIQPQFPFYREKFLAFFSLVESVSMARLNKILSNLRDIDLKLKTSDLSPQVLLESFLFDYCRSREKGFTSKEMR